MRDDINVSQFNQGLFNSDEPKPVVRRWLTPISDEDTTSSVATPRIAVRRDLEPGGYIETPPAAEIPRAAFAGPFSMMRAVVVLHHYSQELWGPGGFPELAASGVMAESDPSEEEITEALSTYRARSSLPPALQLTDTAFRAFMQPTQVRAFIQERLGNIGLSHMPAVQDLIGAEPRPTGDPLDAPPPFAETLEPGCKGAYREILRRLGEAT